MTQYTHSIAMIAPVSVWASLESLLAALGWTLGQGVPLSADGTEPASHLGVNAAAVTQDQYDLAMTGTPEATYATAADWSSERIAAIQGAGSTTASVDQLLSLISRSDAWPDALADAGVVPVEMDADV